jgi:hypothetical protein
MLERRKEMIIRLVSAMLLSALCAAPAVAQTFTDQAPETLIITPRTHYTIPRAYDIPAGQRINDRIRLAPNSWTAGDMQRMAGKRVTSFLGENLGTITAVDIAGQLVQLHTPGGVSVAVPIVLLQDKGDRLFAPTTSQSRLLDMAVRQTGTTVATDVTPSRVALAN